MSIRRPTRVWRIGLTFLTFFAALSSGCSTTNDAASPSRSPASSPSPVPAATHTPTEVPSAPEPGELRAWEHQTECCFAEGSIGVMDVLGADGQPVGPILESTFATLIPEAPEKRGFLRTFPEIALAPGTYTVDVWQIDCWGASAPACGDRQLARDLPRLAPCSAPFEIVAGETTEMVATWSPQDGCLSFEPPDIDDVRPTNISCGDVNLASPKLVFPWPGTSITETHQGWLDELGENEPDLVATYRWSAISYGGESLELIGTALRPSPTESLLAFATFESGGPVTYGPCQLTATSQNFDAARTVLDPDIDPSSSPNELGVWVNEEACANGAASTDRHVLPVNLETPEFVLITTIVETTAGDCPRNPWHAVTLSLFWPLADRIVFDGSTQPVLERPWPPTGSSLQSLGAEQ